MGIGAWPRVGQREKVLPREGYTAPSRPPVQQQVPSMSSLHVSPYLTVVGAGAALDFYRRAFGAVETGPRLTAPDGSIVHAEIRIGADTVMLSEHNPAFGTAEPHSLGGAPVRLALSVENADATVEAATRAGAKVLIPVGDQFYGHRAGRIEDPFGHVWIVTQVIETLSPEEMQRRLDEMSGG